MCIITRGIQFMYWYGINAGGQHIMKKSAIENEDISRSAKDLLWNLLARCKFSALGLHICWFWLAFVMLSLNIYSLHPSRNPQGDVEDNEQISRVTIAYTVIPSYYLVPRQWKFGINSFNLM